MAVKGKKGVFFTFMAIVVVSILVVMFSSDETFTSKNRVPVISARVKTADNFIRNLEGAYIKTSFYTSSYNALKSLLLYMDKQNKFLENEEDLNNKFKEILLDGSINGEDIKTKYGIELMEGNAFKDRLDSIETASESYFHLKTEFSKEDIQVVVFQSNETGPWQVGINLTMNYSIDADVALWNKTKTFTAFLDLTKFDDSLYLINPDSPQHQKIKPTSFNSTQWNITTLRIHVNNGTYRYDENATSYLSRLINSTSRSKCCGIESFVNQTLCKHVEDKSYVDFCFWSNACNTTNSGYGTSLYNITEISNASYPFKLDAYHVGQYNVTDYATFP